ncbi:MAG: hypothetical protein JWO71_1, partial [Candidatus Acidoferrum typicum]|nr:hypothetical protein [Candidatus Acidoferrum typicum]
MGKTGNLKYCAFYCYLAGHRERKRHDFGVRDASFKSVFLILAFAAALWTTGCAGVTGANSKVSAQTSPQLAVNTAQLSFGSVQVGSDSTQKLLVRNTGTGSLTITSATVSGSGFSISGTSLPSTLASGQNVVFAVRFAPTSAGSASGSASFVDSAHASPTVVSLVGIGATQPSAVTSVEVVPSTASVATGETIQFAATVQGSASDRSVNWKAPSGAITSSGFYTAPSRPGTALVTATSNADPTKSASAIVTITSPSASGTLAATPSSANFGSVVVGTKNTQAITLANSGTANLVISQATVSGSGFGFSGLTLPLTVAPGKTAAFTVSFAPSADSGATGNLSLISNASNSPTSIALSGTGVVAAVQVTASPSSLSFGNVNVGSSSTHTVTLTNTGNTNVSVSSDSVSGAGFTISG